MSPNIPVADDLFTLFSSITIFEHLGSASAVTRETNNTTKRNVASQLEIAITKNEPFYPLTHLHKSYLEMAVTKMSPLP